MTIAAGTSPSIATLTDGSYAVAYQTDATQLWVAGQGIVKTAYGMMPGTSPSLAATSDNGWVAAFQSNVGQLCVYSSSGAFINTGAGMRAGTSPSIAVLNNGSYVVAFQANTTQLYIYKSGGTLINTGLGMSNTSPSIAAVGNAFAAAIQANTTQLYLYISTNGALNTMLGMMPGTNPSIARVGYTFKVAFQANTANLYVYSWPDNVSTNTLQGMLNPSTPSIAALSNGGYAVAFIANTTKGAVYVPALGGSTIMQHSLSTGTWPTLTRLAGGDYEVAFNGSSVNAKYWYKPDGNGNTLTARNTAIDASETFFTATPGPGYVGSHNLINGQPPTAGDYCYVYYDDKLAPPPPLSQAISSDLSPFTGLLVPDPRSSYQQGQGSGAAGSYCQMSNVNASTSASEVAFGAYLGAPTVSFGVHHRVQLASDALGPLRPWSTAVFGPNPVFNMTSYDRARVVSPSGNSGYSCVWLIDSTTGQSMEYCPIKWRNTGQACPEPAELGNSCFKDESVPNAPAEYARAWTSACNFEVLGLVGPGARMSNWVLGSAVLSLNKTGDNVRSLYGFQIGRTNLSNAIAMANAYLASHSLLGTVCNTTSKARWQPFGSSSTALDNYEATLFENGVEGGLDMGISHDTWKAWTSY